MHRQAPRMHVRSNAAFQMGNANARPNNGRQSASSRATREMSQIARATLSSVCALLVLGALYARHRLLLADLVLMWALLRNAHSLVTMTEAGRAHALKLAATGVLALVCARQDLASWQLQDIWPSYQTYRLRAAVFWNLLSSRWLQKQWVKQQDVRWTGFAVLLALVQALVLSRAT